MYVSLSWLKEFVDIPDSVDAKALGESLTLKTAEVEAVIDESEKFKNIVAGQILELKAHPNADKLLIAKTTVGKETYDIVCGGKNLKEGMYVVVALPGATVDWHGDGTIMEIKKVKIRGVESTGMICASSELGIENKDEGPKDIMDISALKPTPGTPFAEILNKNDIIFEFDNKSLTHRPDLWGHIGVAREVSAILNKKFKTLKPKVSLPEKGEIIEVEVKDFDLCPRYCGLIINNIKVEESPDWIKSRLKATGHGTHNNIVDITNYVMTELGQPMHAFDKNYIQEKIIVRRANKDEVITTLDGKKYKLGEENLIIADSEKPVAIAGVIGGEHSGINEKTTSIILEAANFNGASVRRTSTSLGVRTESVQRFEKSLDPNLAHLAILRAAELILKLRPDAEIAGPLTDEKNFNEKLQKVDLNIDKVISKIGVNIKSEEIKKILEKIQFTVKEKAPQTLEVTIPSFRANKDIDMEDDLIEEIARLYGYENIPAILPELPTKLPMENKERFKKHRARELFSYGLGFNEVYNYSFYGEDELQKCQMNEQGHLKLLNYLSEDQTHLRISLIPNLLKNCQLNVKTFDSFKLYEIGRTYKDLGKYFPLEEKRIGGAVVKKGKTSKVFYEAKGAVEAFMDKFNISLSRPVDEIRNAPFAHPVQCLSYLNEDGETLIKVFMLHPKVKNAFDLKNYSIAMFEINFSKIISSDAPVKTFKPISKFPKIDFDISVVINHEIKVQTIKDEIKKANKELITNIELFDIYEGDNIEDGKKAVAFKVTLQSSKRTLTDREMSETQKSIFNNLEKLGGTIRGK
ncbi:phenylalanine--tRNA ligase subunit beta [Candidatus Peregrinibacteria bacterium]|nr:phenylalanine--tRNA ligase subunit beta [Candidatus Peregrinibacteria bacterium]